MVRVVHEEQTPEARRLHGVERVLENGWVLASKPRAEIDAWLRKAGISKSTAVLLIDPNGRVKATDARPPDIDFAVLPSFRDSLGR